jgi:flavin-dependent dehydrogenase
VTLDNVLAHYREWICLGYRGLQVDGLDLVLEAGADLLLYTWVSEPLVRDDKIEGVIIDNKSGRQAIVAKVVIDTTGDGDVAARAGVPFIKGREDDGAMRPTTVISSAGRAS